MPDHKCSDPICQRLCKTVKPLIDDLRARKAAGSEASAAVRVHVANILNEFSKEELIDYTSKIITRRAINDAVHRARRESVIGQIVESLADELERRGQPKRV